MISPERILEILASLAIGEIETATAASLAGMDESSFLDYVESNPNLLEQAEENARRLRQSPERTIERSTSGLASAVETIAARIERDGANMPTPELVAASNLLEKLIGLSESRKAEIKAQSSDEREQTAKLPIVIEDTRRNPVSGKERFAIYLIPHGAFGWVDFSDEKFRPPHFDWLSRFAPLSPQTGECLHQSVKELLDGGARYMDASGRILGAT